MPERTRFPIIALLSLSLAVGVARPSGAQESSHAWESVGGAALGTASGLIMGSLGSLVPCNDTYAGPLCVRWVAAGGAVIGGVSGAMLGSRDPERLGDAAVGGGIGLAAGTLAGFALTPFIERWAPQDALAVGLIGGAVGTAPIGAAIGLGAGALVGAVLWQTIPSFGSPRAAAFVLGGIGLGVLTEWAVRALTADEGDPPLTLGFHVAF